MGHRNTGDLELDAVGLALRRANGRGQGRGSASLSDQLLQQLRQRLAQAPPGSRLPSTRALAQALGVSRNTVLRAYERLSDEGHVQGQRGGGSRVRLPPPASAQHAPARKSALSLRWSGLPAPQIRPWPARAFRTGLPPLDLFPFEDWARLQRQTWRRAERGELQLGYAHPAGEPRLREQIALWLRHGRGLPCTPEQVLVTSGAQQGMALAALALLRPGDLALCESPGYASAWAALQLSGARVMGLPVDALGLRPQALQALRGARALMLTPAHQWPTGVTLGLERRLDLLDWAQREQAWMLEDDYAGEYRFEGTPLPPLASLDRAGRCIHIGSFSKLLLPGLRLGYLVLPTDLVDEFARLRLALDRHAPQIEQEVLADFIEQGQLARHLRRARRAAAQRREALQQAWRQAFGDRLPLQAPPSGLNACVPLSAPAQEQRLLAAARAAGVEMGGMNELLRTCAQPGARSGLLLGFGGTPPAEIEGAVATLARVWTALA